MPVIQGADLTSVSTEREPFPDGEYVVTIKDSEIADNKTLIIKSRIESPAEFKDREFWDYINLVQNDGKQNRIGLETMKRYLEAVFGKGSAEAEASPPDTDVLNGHSVTLQLVVSTYTKDGEERKNNKVKRIYPA